MDVVIVQGHMGVAVVDPSTANAAIGASTSAVAAVVLSQCGVKVVLPDR